MNLIERLRDWASARYEVQLTEVSDMQSACEEAADEIERLTNNADNLRQQVEDLTEELRVERLNHGYLREEFDELHTGAVERLRQLQATIKERDALKTVMVAAAEEIHAHWSAHCDAEGYGPANLMRRLEEGIPSEYGYTAGAFARLTNERDALRLDAERYRWLRDESQKKHDFYSDAESWMVSRQQGGMGQNFFGAGIDDAIDTARKEKP